MVRESIGEVSTNGDPESDRMETGLGARCEATIGAGPILLVEDDDAFARLLTLALRTDLGAEVEVAANLSDARARLGAGRFGLAVVDRRLPDGDGIEWVRALRSRGSSLPVIVVTADPAPESAVAAMRAGACDYLVKGRSLVDDVVRAVGAQASARVEAAMGQGGATLVGGSAEMAALRASIAQCARSGACVLVEGETGAGKELVARALHAGSARAHGPFVAVNCGALPEQLVESELFGHVRGAFTGAHRDHPGLVEGAARGTLFLDEVEDLALGLQGKLLRLLQEAEYRPVGAVRSRAADVRVVAASNADLARLVAERRFRADLFYRLNVLRIAVPPLRRRASDVPALVAFHLSRLAAGSGSGVAARNERRGESRGDEPLRDVRMPPAAELAWLMGYRWPGNVRELANLVERAFVFSAASDWPDAWRRAIEGLRAEREADTARSHEPVSSPRDSDRDDVARHGNAQAWSPGAPRDAEPAARDAPPSDPAQALRRVLDRHRWRREAAARELGISRVTLWRRMRRLGLAGDADEGA
jgi:two-component system response regulator PilR (NtrC family)